MYYSYDDYDISIIRTTNGSLFFPSYIFRGWLYYKNGVIAQSDAFQTEARALIWAEDAIRKHKEALELVKRTAKVDK